MKRFVDREEVEEEARVEVEARSKRDKRLQSVCSFDGVARVRATLAVGIAPSVARGERERKLALSLRRRLVQSPTEMDLESESVIRIKSIQLR